MPVWPCLFPIMWGETSLLAHESDHSYDPYIHIQFTKTGETTYNVYNSDYLLQGDIHQDPFRDNGTIILENQDQHFKDIDLQDYKATIKLGLTISGINYTRTLAPFWVKTQDFISQQGTLACQLGLDGILSKLKYDHASTSVLDIGTTAKNLVDKILKATVSSYSHCTAWEVIWHGDSGLDSITLYLPSSAFGIYLGTTRADAVRQLLDFGTSFMRPEDDGKIHMRIPKTSGTDYDHEFALDGHVFFYNNRISRVLIPNSVKVTCETEIGGTEYTFTGTAQDTTSIEAYKEVMYPYRAYDLDSDAEALAIATGILANIRQNASYGQAEVPIAFYLNVLDYIKVTDIRENTTTVGNVGSIDWHFDQKKYRQTIGIGGYWNRRKTGFTQDYIEKPLKREFSVWSSATLPATKLANGQMIAMCNFTIPHYRRLFVRNYTITDSGVPVVSKGKWKTATDYEVDDHVENGYGLDTNGAAYTCTSAHTSGASTEPGVGADWATKWTVYTSPTCLHFATIAGVVIQTHYISNDSLNEVYDSYGVSGTPFTFSVEANGAAADKVMAQVDFCWQYLGGSLP